MLAHALVLHLLFARSIPAPTVHVLPPLELSRSLPALAQAEPSPPPVEPVAPPAGRRSALGRTYASALAGTLASDLVFGGAFAVGIAGAFSDGFFEGRRANAAWAVVALTAAAGFVFVTPGVTVWAAQRAAGRSRAGGVAYAAVFAVRAVGFVVASVSPPILLVTELVAAPLVGAAVVAGGAPSGQGVSPPPGLPEPEPEAEPRPDPAPGGSPISRPLCPDAAFALR